METTFDEIKKHYAAEVDHAAHRTLEKASELPMSYEEITPTWLTSALGGDHAGAEVVAHRLGPVDEGTSSRRRIHLDWNDAGRAAGLPASVFCKSTMTLESRYLLGMNGGIAAETLFFRDVRDRLDIEAPRARFAEFDPRSFNSFIVLDDMADDVTFGDYDMNLTEEQARDQLSVLAEVHAAYHESPALETELAAWNGWEKYFTITVEKAGFGPACARGFQQAEEVIPARLFARADEVWPATLRSVLEHSTLPRTLIHSDPHLKNWYITAGGRMGLNDWQCSCKGHWGRDLAYAMSTALSVEDRRRWERDLIAHYVECLRAGGVTGVSVDDAWLAYRHNLFSALAWWTGTLGQPPEAPDMQPPEASLEFIRRMTHAIDDTDALDSF
ncbi:phosphotransferase [Actinomycetospora sp.]|uniref:phosphotransferase n=1 Tax=Actinomycetospora sp. TaxID=1872135 RepID=UPI002F3E31CC